MIFNEQNRTLALMRGNESAAQFIEIMVEILHFWDDLIDKDRAIDDATVNDRMFKALVTLPRNQFYAQNFATLSVILVNAITNWHIANKFEREGMQDLYRQRIAYILRSSYVDIVTACAGIIGGMDYAIEVGEAIRLHAHKETFDGYQANLEAEFAARSARED